MYNPGMSHAPDQPSGSVARDGEKIRVAQVCFCAGALPPVALGVYATAMTLASGPQQCGAGLALACYSMLILGPVFGTVGVAIGSFGLAVLRELDD